MTQNKEFISSILDHNLWANSNHPLWLSTNFHQKRNLSKFLFPLKADHSSRLQIYTFLNQAIKNYCDFIFKGDDIAPLQKQLLSEHFFNTDIFQKADDEEGYAFNSDANLLFIINNKEHLQMQYNEGSHDLEKGWQSFLNVRDQLNKVLHYAFSPKFGYLTSNPLQCGTGLIITVYLHLPALMLNNDLASQLEKLKDERIFVGDIRGSSSSYLGDIVAIQNHFTLGISEEEIISSLKTFANKLMKEELFLRDKFKAATSPEVKNSISRAFGLLKHSYELDINECLKSLSLCKLGIDLGLLKGIDHKILNSLYFDSQRAHLLAKLSKTDLSQEDLAIKRAQIIKEKLQNCSIQI